ncbi:hypothetical protein [Flagellimonas okinawensis]|uniref:DUF5703 domain-containing protein n=1 Tax=Flagellimonas okinawensis TaxID=3031324 RepID=A0ABT5XSZ9_9FLAO|nr:hypothetical protein [[Muricauda] okinawensis]MDF0709020.1 hypothetical protein [[Muricauda] okinawensis]
MRILITVLLACFLLESCTDPETLGKQLEITVENNKEGAPITLGIPFPKGELNSVDHMRLLTADGKEIPCQTTEVSNWGPADDSVKWAWVFFFSEETTDYVLEYGDGVVPMQPTEKIISTNNMRPQGGIDVNTGPISFSIHKKGNGFLDEVFLDSNKDGKFDPEELIASSPEKHRGSFLDLLDDAGLDASKAVINEVFREKGSGPMHTIFRVEGTYTYSRADNNLSPFTMWLHAYAGKSYIKVLHTMTYTGIPDKHTPQEGEHANIATQNAKILTEQTEDDMGWTQPNDQIAASGLQLKYHLDDDVSVSMPLYNGSWQNDGADTQLEEIAVGDQGPLQLLQKGPGYRKSTSLRSLYLNNFDDNEKSGDTGESLDFEATVSQGGKELAKTERAKGWMNITDGKRGVGVGIKNFMKEYPKGIEVDPSTGILLGSVWPKENGPMSFARHNTEPDGGMLDNFAQGITKTTEFIYYFHENEATDQVGQKMDYVVDAPVAHATPDWYTASKVYGNMAPASAERPEFENALQYRYQWWAYSQKHEPWYGIFNYGDGKSYFFNGRWVQWTNNEPTVDFMLWTNFMRTGDPEYFKLAQAMSRHTMDVDNIHWPKKRTYYGEVNDAIDFWNYEDEPESTPYLGIGRRHANEHWYALLSAHVWIQGWIADYYLAADHRALEVAKMTGDTYIKRIWGEHDLRGRRLYLSVLNLVELYDATKLNKYRKELDERVDLMLELQERQGGNLLLDRYGYSQTYVAQGLYKYQQITGNEEVRKALLKHARWVRDVPPLNHEMESYLATIYPLLLGYEISGEKVYLDEALARAEKLKIGELPKSPEDYPNASEYSEDLLEISNLPMSKGRFTNWQTNQGLRVFGWTHAYNIPYLLYWMDRENID